MELRELYKRKQQELAEAHKAYKSFWDNHDNSKELSADQKNTVKELGKKADAIAAEFEEIADRFKRTEEGDAFLKSFNTPVNALGNGATGNDGATAKQAAKNLLDLLKENEDFARQLKESPRSVKTLITASNTSAGDLLVPQRLDSLYDPGVFRRELTVLDIVRRIPVSTDSIEWPFLDTVTNNAAPVPHADNIATSDDTGRFPESAMTWDKKSVTMKWIGHTIPVPESLLQDIPALMGFIGEFLIYGVREQVETQIITGDGTGDNFTGILSTSGIQTQAFSNSMFESLRKAKTKVTKNGRAQRPSIIITPENWESIELALDANERYIMGGPVGTMTAQLWGMPVIANEGLTANHAIVGDFGWAAYFDRMQVELSTHFENRDFIEKNLVAMRARTRGQFGVIRPKAFVDVTMA